MSCGCKKKQIVPQAPPPSQPPQPTTAPAAGVKIVLKENISPRPPVPVDPSLTQVNRIVKKLDAIRSRQFTNRKFSLSR